MPNLATTLWQPPSDNPKKKKWLLLRAWNLHRDGPAKDAAVTIAISFDLVDVLHKDISYHCHRKLKLVQRKCIKYYEENNNSGN